MTFDVEYYKLLFSKFGFDLSYIIFYPNGFTLRAEKENYKVFISVRDDKLVVFEAVYANPAELSFASIRKEPNVLNLSLSKDAFQIEAVYQESYEFKPEEIEEFLKSPVECVLNLLYKLTK